MLKTEVRPLEPAERATLEALLGESAAPLFDLRKPAQRIGALLVLLLFALLGFVAGTFLATSLYLLSRVFPALEPLAAPPAVRVLLGGGALLGAVGIPLFMSTTRRKALGAQRGLISRDLAEGRAEVTECESGRALRYDLNGEEPLYFVEAESDRVLFLTGDYLDRAALGGRFPNTHFRVARGAHSRRVLGVECLGDPFDAEPTDIGVDLDAALFPLDGDVLRASLETLERDLEKRSEARSETGPVRS